MRVLTPPPVYVPLQAKARFGDATHLSGEWSTWFSIVSREESWQDVTFENSWADVGGAYYGAQYRQDVFGRVELRGRIDTGTSGTVAFTLPERFRPNATLSFSTDGTAGGAPLAARVEIDSGGQVTPTLAGAGIEISLDGVRFASEK